jgi:hypothetical protein
VGNAERLLHLPYAHTAREQFGRLLEDRRLQIARQPPHARFAVAGIERLDGRFKGRGSLSRQGPGLLRASVSLGTPTSVVGGIGDIADSPKMPFMTQFGLHALLDS